MTEGIEHQVRRLLDETLESSSSATSRIVDLALTTEPRSGQLFVGREQELNRLKKAFDAASEGSGSVAMVVGEPGMGKTALCDQLTSYVIAREGEVMFGRCEESAATLVPYGPLREALRPYILTEEIEELREQLGDGIAEIVQVIPELESRVGNLQIKSGLPDEKRIRLLRAVSTFLTKVAARRPLLLVLDDLHDSDKGTLDLILNLSAQLKSARILVVGTYRPIEVGRTHPLSGTLADLRRRTEFLRLSLRGLPLAAVEELVAATLPDGISKADAEAVHRRTEGNPLFIKEVLITFAEEAARSPGTGRGPRAAEVIPEGLREAVGKRLSQLSDRTNRLLATASVIGREFNLKVLKSVSGMSDDEMYECLEEASQKGLIEGRQQVGHLSFQFVHAIFREVLYQEIFQLRRIRLHEQVGAALEENFSHQVADYAAEIADHFAHSIERSSLEKALNYYRLAAQKAIELFSFADGVRILEQALAVLEVLDPNDSVSRCDLLLFLSDALTSAGLSLRVIDEVAPEAYSLATAIGDKHRAWRAAYSSCFSRESAGGDYAWATSQGRIWIQRLVENAEPGTKDAILADWLLARSLVATGEPKEAWRISCRALEAARLTKDPVLVTLVSFGILSGEATPAEAMEGRLSLATELVRNFPQILENSTFNGLLGLTYISAGLRDQAEESGERLMEIARRAPTALNSLAPLNAAIVHAQVEGRLEESVKLCYEIAPMAANIGRIDFGRHKFADLVRRSLLYMGRTEEALEAQGPISSQPSSRWPSVAACLAKAGRIDEARQLTSKICTREGFGLNEGAPVYVLCNLLDAALATDDKPLMDFLISRLQPYSHLLFASTNGLWCIGRLVADACALLGRDEESRAAYEAALGACEAMGFRPEAALCHLGLAELDLREGGSSRATQHLSIALPEFAGMGMTPAHTRASLLCGQDTAPSVQQRTNIGGLSSREIDVLRLIAQGKTNHEISESLVISMNTVASHISHIFSKIDASNRTEAASFAHRNALL